MTKIFNVSANCKPSEHYMVDITEKLHKIKEMVDKGQYFTINRARQYGKTTTLRALEEFLKDDYIVVSLDFQMLSASKFKNENIFSIAFAKMFLEAIQGLEVELQKSVSVLKDAIKIEKEEIELFELFQYLSKICASCLKPIVLMIDEVDSATNNQVFLDFLAQLRGYYIKRDRVSTFQSVILAGVYDVKNIRHKIGNEEEHKVNSPWNIAADFLVDMSFSQKDIGKMLKEYETDYHIGMDIEMISELLYSYTSGYPFLVSRICKLMDERIAGNIEYPDKKSAWTKDGFLEAVKILLREKNTLFESLINKLTEYSKLREIVYMLLFEGKEISYNPLNQAIEIAELFGFIKNVNGSAIISNRIFETV